MRIKFIYIVLTFFLLECSNAGEINKGVKLVSFTASFLRPSPREDYLDTVRIKEIIRKEKKGDTLEIDIELASSGCVRFDGDVKVKADSLILSYWIISDTTCATLERYELKYRILDRLNQDYRIGLKYVN